MLAAGCAAHDQPAPKTWALLIGISKYPKLPQDLWLQYPDSDARQLAAFLESARGGGVPPEQIRLLTNEQATLSSVRDSIATFLRTKPGPADTVYIFVAGHGTVDSTGAYILTADSDPENLSRTALPMGELHTAVNAEMTKAARVILLADVCRAASIAGTKTDSLGAEVKGLGEGQGELLGLMAARPKELSNEAPQFGGGHGAFTWSLLRGLSGAADTDKDGFVTVGELIAFVYDDVKKLTGDRQHPTDFGNMEDSTKLSDLSRPGVALP
jgi:uncharacterized caspase-like protein